MLNKIILMGRLGRDPDVHYTQGGTPVASFSLAVDRDFVDQATGRRPTDWIGVVAWGARAKFAQQYFRKGQLTVVEGRLQIRDWTDQEGNKRRSAEVVAEQIYFAGAKVPPPSEGNADERQLLPNQGSDFQELDGEDNGGELPF